MSKVALSIIDIKINHVGVVLCYIPLPFNKISNLSNIFKKYT